MSDTVRWRATAVRWLEEQGFDGTVIIPEFKEGRFEEQAPVRFGAIASATPGMGSVGHGVLEWETTGIETSTLVLFWMPFQVRAKVDPESLPGFTTRAEVARELTRDPRRLVLGMPPVAVSSGHIRYHAHRAGVRIWPTLEQTLEAALARLHR